MRLAGGPGSRDTVGSDAILLTFDSHVEPIGCYPPPASCVESRPCNGPDSAFFPWLSQCWAHLTLISFASKSSAADPSVADERKLETWWADLEKGEPEASRALLNLAARPKSAVLFLKTRLKPLTISSGQVKALLLKLGSSNEALWKPAFEELEYFDPRLAIDLQTLMDRYTEYPVRRRLVEVLSGRDPDSLKDYEDLKIRPVGDGFNFSGNMAMGVMNWWAEHRLERLSPSGGAKKKWTRAVCAIVLLEHISNSRRHCDPQRNGGRTS